MIQLARHIETLLLENDCVVIPGFGGIIAYDKSAVWNKEENLFIPPARTIGFNPQLKMNDGLLVQSYMKANNTSYAEANKILQKDIEEITGEINREGKIILPYIGEITYAANESYIFSPYNEKLTSPLYYGLHAFEIADLSSLKGKTNKELIGLPESKNTFSKYINPIWQSIAAVAAVVLFFFIMSTPIENTYIESANYANILPAELFDKIKSQSLITTNITIPGNASKVTATATDTATYQSKNVPVVKEVRVPKSQAEVINNDHSTAELKYHLIVASVVKEDDGKQIVENLHSKGYSKARIISGDGRVRVGIASYATREEASKELQELRKIESYQNAWLLIK